MPQGTGCLARGFSHRACPLQGLREALGADRDNQEVLDVDAVRSMRAPG